MIWLVIGIVVLVLVLLFLGGVIARNRQLSRSRPAFERSLTQVDRDLAAAAAADRGWDRAHLESEARRICAEQLGAEPEELTLVEVLDRPGTDEDEAVFAVTAGGRSERLRLGRRDGRWVASSRPG